jgi:hypothetical protein
MRGGHLYGVVAVLGDLVGVDGKIVTYLCLLLSLVL